ncbi:MAG: pyridoxamine kinase [Clostridium sp.]|nr:pyridoxamine kinase [Clostridium sp.]
MGKIKKIALINDIAGYGRCSMTAAIPVISAMGVQCCPMETAVLSNHTGYPDAFFDDYTDRMPAYMDAWKRLGFSFDGIMTGYLGSPAQAGIVGEFIRQFKSDQTLLLVDPAMGDNGDLYRVCTDEMCEAMKDLIQYADVVTPNLTEACFLTDTPFADHGWSRKKLTDLVYRLLMLGAKSVVITGVPQGDRMVNVSCVNGGEVIFTGTRRLGGHFHGTGDVFASVVSAGILRGMDLADAVRLGASFTVRCIAQTIEDGTPEQEGLSLETCLPYLLKQKHFPAGE